MRRVFGIAYLWQRRPTNNPVEGPKKVVIKKVPFEGLDMTLIGEAVHECKALKMLRHPNIVRYRGSWIADNCGRVLDDPATHWDAKAPDPRMPPGATYAVPDALYIMTDYADGGSLDNLLKRNMLKLCREGHIHEDLIQVWLAQLVLAIDHMHACGFLHRDLKPANIFITKNGVVKVGDLGGALMIDQPDAVCESEYGAY